MQKRQWKTKIKKACIDAGTYKKYFDYAIDTLATILEKRDEAEAILNDENEDLVVEQTNKGGFTNRVKNPAYVMWDEMNKTALTYWRELGLTPAGLKKINEEAFIQAKKEQNGNDLLSLLNSRKAVNG